MDGQIVKKVELDDEALNAILNALYERSDRLRKEGECFAEQEVLDNLYDLMCGSDVTILATTDA